MTGFTADWLKLREPLDERARAVELTWGFGRALPAHPLLIDLGSGTGSSVRHLANRLGRPQQDWALIERDMALMTRAPAELKRWGEKSGLLVTEKRRGLRISGDELDLSIDMRILDLNARLSDLDLGVRDGVTANALFDLVSRRWLELFAAELGAAGYPPLLATTIVDGRLFFAPEDPQDDLIRSLFTLHQQRDKGFGPALGGDAPLALVELVRDGGYRIDTARSDWRVGARNRTAQLYLLSGYETACTEQDPDSAELIAGWAKRRREQAAEGTLDITVGHADILAHR